jgi:hypothetical protein
VWDLVEENFRNAQQRVERNLRELPRNQDAAAASVGEKALSGRYPSLTDGIIQRNLQDYSRQESALKTDDENGRKVV